MTKGKVTGGWAWRHHRRWLRDLVAGKPRRLGRRDRSGPHRARHHHVARAVREDENDAKPGRRSPTPPRSATSPSRPSCGCPSLPTLFAAAPRGSARSARGTTSRPISASSPAIAEVQAASQDGLPAPGRPPAEALERAARHAMPPLDRAGFAGDAALAALIDRLVAGAAPRHAGAGRARRSSASPRPMRRARPSMVANVLGDAIPVEAIAEHVLVAAALQVHFARAGRAARPGGAEAGRRRRLPRLRRRRRSASLVVGWPRGGGHALLLLLALRDALELRAREVHALRLDQGDLVPRDRRRRRRREGRDSAASATATSRSCTSRRTRRSTRSPTTSRRSGSTFWCASSTSGVARVNPFLVGY